MQKSITRIEHPRQKHWVGDGFHVAQYIPGYGRQMSDDTSPFLMLDYNTPRQLEPQKDGHRPGVGYHPHRGFETVTIVYAGEVEHQDTAGNGGIIGADEVQWMTAGSGLLHNEFFTSEFARMGGMTHFVQLWVNLPREHKMTTPGYQALTRDIIPEVAIPGGRVRVIAGEFEGVTGAAKTYSPVELYDIRFDSEGSLDLPFRDGDNAMILVIEGSIVVGDRKLETADMAYFSLFGDRISLIVSDTAKILVMAGTPLHEPVVNYGPFVMNTQIEIMQAFADLNAGKMGRVRDEFGF